MTQPGTQFRGWPRSFDMLANYGRKSAAQLPRLTIQGVSSPLVEVIDETTNELLYCLRLPNNSWQPHVFSNGKHTVRISDPETGKAKELKGLVAKAGNDASLEVTI